MISKSYYVVLPSDSSRREYPNNIVGQIVGDQITDLLHEIPYHTKGMGSQYIEPMNLQ